MLEKGFLHNQTNKNSKHKQIASTVSNVLLYLGMLVLGGSFIYLLFNLGKSGTLVSMMMPFLVAGLGLIFVSLLIRRAYSKLKR